MGAAASATVGRSKGRHGGKKTSDNAAAQGGGSRHIAAAGEKNAKRIVAS